MDILLTGIRSGQTTIPKNQIVVPTFIAKGAELPALIRMLTVELNLTGIRILIPELREIPGGGKWSQTQIIIGEL